MIVCPEKKIGFIHVYKTGGSSLTRVLAEHTIEGMRMQSPRFDGDGWQGTWHVNGEQHSKYAQNRRLLNGLVDGDWRYVVICRNPYDWFASVFYEFYKQDRQWKSGFNFIFGKLSKNRTFEDFIDFYTDFKGGYPDFWGFSSQKSFVDGVPQGHLNVIRFEEYRESVVRVLTEAGVPVDGLQHDLKRGSEKDTFKSYLKQNPLFVPFVNRVFEADFEFFDYEML